MKKLISILLISLIQTYSYAQENREFEFQIQKSSDMMVIVAFSPDGRIFATGTFKTGSIMVWETSTGRLLRSFKFNKNAQVDKLGISKDYIIKAGQQEQRMRCWNAANGEEVECNGDFDMNIPRRIYEKSLDNGSKLQIEKNMNAYDVFVTQEDEIIFQLNRRSGIGNIMFSNRVEASQNGQYLAYISDDIFIFDIQKDKLIRRIKLPGEHKPSNINIDKQGKYFVVNGDYNSCRIWDLHSGRVKTVLSSPGISYADISGDGTKIVYTSKLPQEGFGGVYSIRGKKICTIPFRRSPMFSPDERAVYHTVRDIEYVDDRPWAYIDIVSGELTLDKNGRLERENELFHKGVKFIKRSTSGKSEAINLVDYPKANLVISTPEGIRTIESSKKNYHMVDFVDATFNRKEDKIYFQNDGYPVLFTLDLSSSKSKLVPFDLEEAYQTSSISLSQNDERILTCTGEGLLIHDTNTGKIIDSTRTRKLRPYCAEFTPDEKYILSSFSDRTIKLFDANSLDQIVSFIPAGEKDYAVITPDGYYSASKGLSHYLHFVDGLRTYGFENFDLALNRPDIVAERIGYASPQQIAAYKNAYLKRLKKMGFTEDQISNERHLPTVEVLTQGIPFETAEGSFTFKIKGEDEKYNLDRINVYVNGVPIYGMKGQSIKDQSTSALEQEISLELSSGDNNIQVSVHNEKGAESIKESFSIVCSKERPSNTYVVAIGISDYQNDEFDLNYAAKDANDIATKFGTDASKVFSITDGNAVKEKILAIKEQLMNSKVDDRVVLFVAGHGLLDDNLDYFIGMHDVDFENPAARGLPYEDLEGLLDGIPARKKLMFIDACHSGEVDKDDSELVASNAVPEGTISARGFKTIASKSESLGLENSFQLMQELFADLRKGTGAVVISSASGAEFALESDAWQNGVFTYSILEGLEGRKCDTDKDGAVQVSELKDYVFDRVAELTNGKQHPTSRRENLEHDFVVW